MALRIEGRGSAQLLEGRLSALAAKATRWAAAKVSADRWAVIGGSCGGKALRWLSKRPHKFKIRSSNAEGPKDSEGRFGVGDTTWGGSGIGAAKVAV